MVDELRHIGAVGWVIGGVVPPSDEEESECREHHTCSLEPDALLVPLPQECQQDTSEDEEYPDDEDEEDDGHLHEIVPVLVVHEVG